MGIWGQITIFMAGDIYLLERIVMTKVGRIKARKVRVGRIKGFIGVGDGGKGKAEA